MKTITPNKLWTSDHGELIIKLNEGWDVFETSHGTYEIEADGDQDRFKSDDEAIRYVVYKALQGSTLALRALMVHGRRIDDKINLPDSFIED